MQAAEIMTENPVCCTPDTKLSDVARQMVEFDCGAIPVVDNASSRRLVGIVTDRDIVCRILARGQDPRQTTARECMSGQTMTVNPGNSVDDCCRVMSENMIRRVMVVDQDDRCIGIVSQADVANHVPAPAVGNVLREVSQPSDSSSRLAA